MLAGSLPLVATTQLPFAAYERDICGFVELSGFHPGADVLVGKGCRSDGG